MSPFVAELLLGDFSLDATWIILVVGPLYGGGALLVRETTRRLGLGWATILLLALAYGLLEEGVVIQTLFNPNYLGLHLLRHAYIPELGISGWWTPFVLTLHTVWSISVPIAIIEALFADRRTQPWLGKIGLGVATLLFVGGALLLHSTQRKQDPFAASNVQLLCTWIAIAAVIALAVRCRPSVTRKVATVPPVWMIGVLGCIWGLAFMTVNKALEDWPLAGAQWALDALLVTALIVWGRRSGWSPLHTLAAAGGAMLAYAYHGFPMEPVVGSKGTIDLVGNTLFAIIAITLLAFAVKKERKRATVSIEGPAVPRRNDGDGA